MNQKSTHVRPARKPRFPPAPAEYAGKWVAWTRDRMHIVASGDDVAKVRADAIASGESDPILQKVHPLDARIVGASAR